MLEEKMRIEAVGGYVDDGYLNGYLSVARAFGNWHVDGLKGDNGPLSAEPEVERLLLTEDDEFMIIGCDGLWDVFENDDAIRFARRELQKHNDPVQCSRALVDEALRRHSSDNLTVVTVCFQASPPPDLCKKFVFRRKNRQSNGVLSDGVCLQ
jgi:protein phosphatase 2C family protein 2/3